MTRLNDTDLAFAVRLPEDVEGQVLKALLSTLTKLGLSTQVSVSRHNQEGEVDGIAIHCTRGDPVAKALNEEFTRKGGW